MPLRMPLRNVALRYAVMCAAGGLLSTEMGQVSGGGRSPGTGRERQCVPSAVGVELCRANADVVRRCRIERSSGPGTAVVLECALAVALREQRHQTSVTAGRPRHERDDELAGLAVQKRMGTGLAPLARQHFDRGAAVG